MLYWRRQALEGERIPWGYGVAYWRTEMAAAVCYPIPFNWIVRWIRAAVIWLMHPTPSYKERYEFTAKAFEDLQKRFWALQEDAVQSDQKAFNAKREGYREAYREMETRVNQAAKCLCIRENGRCDCFSECRCANCSETRN